MIKSAEETPDAYNGYANDPRDGNPSITDGAILDDDQTATEVAEDVAEDVVEDDER